MRAGRLNALAVLGNTRSPLLPQTPTVSESGVPGFELTNWFGMVVPVATPRDLVTRIHGDVTKVLAQPDIRDRIRDMGADVVGNSTTEFAAFMRAESAKWGKIVKQANIRME